MNLLVNLGGGLRTRKNEGGENRKTESKGKEWFVETIDFGFLFWGHGIILTCGI